MRGRRADLGSCRESGSSLVPQATPVGSRASGSASHCLITTNMLVWIQGGSKHENEIVNVGAKTAGCPSIVTLLCFPPNTTPILSGTTISPT